MPGPLYLLDTSIVLHLIRANPLGQYISSTFDLENPDYRPLVSIVTHGELRVMADRNSWGPKKLAAPDNALANLVTIDLASADVLEAYLVVDRVSRAQPKGSRTLSNNDLWIAACAVATSAVILTTDKDFLHLHPEPCQVHWVDPNRDETS